MGKRKQVIWNKTLDLGWPKKPAAPAKKGPVESADDDYAARQLAEHRKKRKPKRAAPAKAAKVPKAERPPKKVPRGRIGAGGAPMAGAECDHDCETCSAEDCDSRDGAGPGH